MDPVRALAHVHGHVGWLAVAILAHPAIVLRRAGRAPSMWSPALATGIVTLQAALGAFLYPAYRDRLKQKIFQTEPQIGWLFERKEHLAFGVVLVAWIALVTCILSRRQGGDRVRMARSAGHAYAAGAALAFVVAVLGTIVAIHRPL